MTPRLQNARVTSHYLNQSFKKLVWDRMRTWPTCLLCYSSTVLAVTRQTLKRDVLPGHSRVNEHLVGVDVVEDAPGAVGSFRRADLAKPSRLPLRFVGGMFANPLQRGVSLALDDLHGLLVVGKL